MADFETATSNKDQLDLRVWLRLFTCANLIESNVRTNLRTGFDTTLPRFDLLAQLDRAPNGLTMGELSRRLMVSNGNVTGLIDRLDGEGLVRRELDPNDRRVQRVALTQAGKTTFANMAPAHSTWVSSLTANMDRAELAKLYDLLGQLKSSIQTAPNQNG